MNKTCLQKPKPQTRQSNPGDYKPHMHIKAAKREGYKENSYYESSKKLRAFILDEEKQIDIKLNNPK